MEISSSQNSVTIKGNIKSINDFQDIKICLDEMKSQYSDITLNIVDSLSITSCIIGYLNKLVLKDGINLNLQVGSMQLMDLLNDLNLASTFNAKKI
jgi:hypothetical protein